MAQCCFDNLTQPLVLDTSVAINLNATGSAHAIVNAIPNDFILVNIVEEELNKGNKNKGANAESVTRLIADGLIKISQLGEEGEQLFTQLVSGDAKHTLDDGEAATIALAIETGTIALIDERKATKICANHFPSLKFASTGDLFGHPHVLNVLGPEGLADAIYYALQKARMNVHEPHLEWIVNLIGYKRVATCRSLPKRIRENISFLT